MRQPAWLCCSHLLLLPVASKLLRPSAEAFLPPLQLARVAARSCPDNFATLANENRNENRNDEPTPPDGIDRSPTLYEILGCASDASRDEIKKKYISLARKVHPDATIGRERRTEEESTLDFADVAAAWEVLGDPKLRLRYDRTLMREEFTNRFEGAAESVLRDAFGTLETVAETVGSAAGNAVVAAERVGTVVGKVDLAFGGIGKKAMPFLARTEQVAGAGTERLSVEKRSQEEARETKKGGEIKTRLADAAELIDEESASASLKPNAPEEKGTPKLSKRAQVERPSGLSGGSDENLWSVKNEIPPGFRSKRGVRRKRRRKMGKRRAQTRRGSQYRGQDNDARSQSNGVINDEGRSGEGAGRGRGRTGRGGPPSVAVASDSVSEEYEDGVLRLCDVRRNRCPRP